MKCPICNGELIYREQSYNLYNRNLGNFQAGVCNKCNEAFFTEEASNAIDTKAKELGL